MVVLGAKYIGSTGKACKVNELQGSHEYITR